MLLIDSAVIRCDKNQPILGVVSRSGLNGIDELKSLPVSAEETVDVLGVLQREA